MKFGFVATRKNNSYNSLSLNPLSVIFPDSSRWENRESPKTAEYLIQKSKEKHKNQSHITEMERLKRKLQGIKEQIEALAEHLSKIPKGISPLPIFNQMQKLETLKTETEIDLNAFIESGVVVDEPSQIKDYQAYLKAIRNIQGFTDSAILKSKIIKLLVAKIEPLPNSFKLHYFIGKSVTTQSQTLDAEQTSASGPSPSSPFLNFGSNSLSNGGPSLPNPQLFRSTIQVTDLIPFSMKKPWENASLLHQKYIVLGLSLKLIAREFFCSKNTIRSALKRNGLPLRKRQERGRASNPRYGSKQTKGHPVAHLGEQRIISTIMEMREEGVSFTKIAKFLTAAGVPTKIRKKGWHPEVVRQIYLNNANVNSGISMT